MQARAGLGREWKLGEVLSESHMNERSVDVVAILDALGHGSFAHSRRI